MIWSKPFIAYLYLLEILDEIVGKAGGRSRKNIGESNWRSRTTE